MTFRWFRSILVDEPTANLDSSRAFEVVELIRKEVKNRYKAAIMLTYDERIRHYCKKVYKVETVF